ncbi:hypothetical protein FEZ18_03800 [Oceanihabitans sp. IOP_32]|uniref:hypothetical protein n=1 Tax=Oceanihabitans sp. IOP_32 TaxID=2529032 RepID=UPI00129343FB|nr:hypothetical protein [Oceanihabitans sp. IOP_32]QFZ53991.1 hypothetical protein FEZ18_03800 [Oceanihabitans sp. IOP_32]
MYLKKLFSQFKLKSKKNFSVVKTQNLKSHRITIRDNITLNEDSDYKTVMKCMDAMNIQVKNKSVEQLEQEIDRKVIANLYEIITEYPDDKKIKGIGEEYLKKTDNRNLIMIKRHLNSLKYWLEN